MKKIKDLQEYLEKMFRNPNKKKIIENSIIVIIIGVIVIISGGVFFKKEDKAEVPVEEASEIIEVSNNNTGQVNIDEIEGKLEGLLSKVQGAGKVEVMVTYVSGRELVPAYDIKKNDNDTKEKDTGGGTRNIVQTESENKVVYEENKGGEKKPVILKEVLPQVKGVVVIAQGSEDPEVKENLLRAVQVLLDVPVHKIQVLKRGTK